MIIKKIVLNNIRSYKHEEVEFKKGSTLLSGDIGSGKTSILLAIEFALFGLQPGQRGAFLLRNGEDVGGVTMDFEVDEKEFSIERTLKRGKTVSQDYTAITIEGVKTELAVTELKNRVLDILKYPKEFSKKQNLLYKFTVYTPQEEMKQIILQDADTRMNTLRHVFGIDKYKRILENISFLTQKLREEKRIKEALVLNLEEERLEILSKEQKLEDMKLSLIEIEIELIEKQNKRKLVEAEEKEIEDKIEEKSKLSSENEKTKIMILTKQETIKDNERLISQLETQVKDFANIKFEESMFEDLNKQIQEKRNEKEKLNKIILEISGEISSLNDKNRENESLKQKMSNLEMCPTCLQDVDSVYRSNILNKAHNETSQNNARLQELKEKLNELNLQRTNAEANIHEKENKSIELKLLKLKLESINEKEKRKQDSINLNKTLEQDITLLKQHAETLNHSIFELSKFDKIFEIKRQELNQALKQERIADIKLAEVKKEIEMFSRQILELKEKVKKSEEIKQTLNYISELENWLSKKFTPLVAFVEKNVMVKLKSDFSDVFQEWFLMLVSESFNVGLREDFTPVVEQQDYEIDYAYLSGGERTAIALAYRLALNQVINSVMSKIKTKQLVILDEPTDGFSEQQLDKMRSVLEQLNTEQLIIVSHEQKIEGFVENVIKFKKEDGVSVRA